MSTHALLTTIPHAGEKVPDLCPWLKNLPERILMFDVDRYVDFLYEPALKNLQIPFVKTQWHRYAADLNRIPTDIDKSTVLDATEPAGKFSRGFHWAITTEKYPLMPAPMSRETHDQLTKLIYEPFHKEVQDKITELKKRANIIFHIDLHSMPSMGTSEHRDPGERRADAVISDVDGTSCMPAFKDLVLSAFDQAGFKTAYNWPYKGGRITEQYGKPKQQHHCIQVELNRSLYMDEYTKALKPDLAGHLQTKLGLALATVQKGLADIHR